MRTLLFGYGNADRQDDGVAWHVLHQVKLDLGLPNPESIPEELNDDTDPALLFQLQLTPEDAEGLAAFDRICFIDAHTGAVPEEIHFVEIAPSFQHSPLTHHLTPQSLLSIIQTLYHKDPKSVLISVRGYEFEFTPSLSKKTADLVPIAANKVLDWLFSNQ